MTIKEVQATVDSWIQDIGGGYFSHLTNMAVLTEETGELARVISRTYGEQRAKPGDFKTSPKDAMAEELADILWVVACLANQSDIDLEEAFKAALRKKTHRDANRFK